jgi:hypothetical protein
MTNGMSEEDAHKIMQRHSASLRGLPGVFSVGIEKDSSGELVLKVRIDRDLPIPNLPREIEGLKVLPEPAERVRRQ